MRGLCALGYVEERRFHQLNTRGREKKNKRCMLNLPAARPGGIWGAAGCFWGLAAAGRRCGVPPFQGQGGRCAALSVPKCSSAAVPGCQREVLGDKGVVAIWGEHLGGVWSFPGCGGPPVGQGGGSGFGVMRAGTCLGGKKKRAKKKKRSRAGFGAGVVGSWAFWGVQVTPKARLGAAPPNRGSKGTCWDVSPLLLQKGAAVALIITPPKPNALLAFGVCLLQDAADHLG